MGPVSWCERLLHWIWVQDLQPSTPVKLYVENLPPRLDPNMPIIILPTGVAKGGGDMGVRTPLPIGSIFW